MKQLSPIIQNIFIAVLIVSFPFSVLLFQVKGELDDIGIRVDGLGEKIDEFVFDPIVGAVTRVRIGEQVRWTSHLIPSASFTVNLGSGSLPVSKGFFINASVSSDFEVTRIASASLVYAGAGTAASPSFAFNIDQDGGMFRPAVNEIAFSTLGAERVRINSSGNVGIGTTAPTGKLDIGFGGLSLVLGADNTASTRTDGTEKVARIAGYHLTNAEEPMAIAMADSLSGENRLYLGGGSGLMNAATSILFYTAANQTTVTGTERMRIDSAGNVGIGTTSPATKFEVQGTASASYLLTGNTLQVGGYSSAAYSRFGTGTATLSGLSGSSDLLVSGDFQVLSSAAFTGNVGIGTDNPTTKLDVIGAASISTTFEVITYASATQYFGGVSSHSFGGTLEGRSDNAFSIGTVTKKIKEIISNIVRVATKLVIPTRTSTNVNETGALAVNTASSSLNFHDGTAERPNPAKRCFGINHPTPTAKDHYTIWNAYDPFTISEVYMIASGSNAAGWQLRHGTTVAGLTNTFSTNKSASGSAEVKYTSFADATLVNGERMDFVITSASATIDNIFVRTCGFYDP